MQRLRAIFTIAQAPRVLAWRSSKDALKERLRISTAPRSARHKEQSSSATQRRRHPVLHRRRKLIQHQFDLTVSSSFAR